MVLELFVDIADYLLVVPHLLLVFSQQFQQIFGVFLLGFLVDNVFLLVFLFYVDLFLQTFHGAVIGSRLLHQFLVLLLVLAVDPAVFIIGFLDFEVLLFIFLNLLFQLP